MTLRLCNLALPISQEQDEIEGALLRKLNLSGSALRSWRVERRSLDARKIDNIRFVYSVIFEVEDEKALISNARPDVKLEQYEEYSPPEINPGSEVSNHRPVVVGAGPAGMFAALLLAKHGYRPLVIERGASIEKRVEDAGRFLKHQDLNPESNILFGEGGAGTFSDGKLNTRIKNKFALGVLRELVDCGAPEEILIQAKPHLGTNGIRKVVEALRQKIESLGGEFRFDTKVTELIIEGSAVKGVRCGEEEIPAQSVFLAIGHSARDTFRSLRSQGVSMERKTFQLGLRVEHSQGYINHVMFGKMSGHPKLGAAEYSLVFRGIAGVKPVFTFCMCPGGEVLPATAQAGHLCTNGMSWSARNSKFGNSALMTSLDPEELPGDDVFSGMEFQEILERRCFKFGGSDYHVPAQKVTDFLRRRRSQEEIESSCQTGTAPVEWSQVLAPSVGRSLYESLRFFERIMPGFTNEKAVLLGPETRGSSPVRLPRHQENYQSESHSGLYPVGEGAGYAGGIISAAVDGLNSARIFINKFAPVK